VRPGADSEAWAYRPPSRTARLCASLLAAAWALACLYRTLQVRSGAPTDFDHLWFAARAALDGRDPYALVGPGRTFDWPWQLYYPGSALVAVAPLATLPLALARAVFVALSAALLCWGVTREGWWRFPLFVSAPFCHAASAAQWSPLVAAAFLLPALAVIAGVKPTVGLAVLASARTQRMQIAGVVAGGVLVAASVVLLPSWPSEWWAATRSARHLSAPVAHFAAGGPLVLLALARWRRPEARLLAVLACVPQSTVTYEGLYFLLLPETIRGVMAFTAVSWVGAVLQEHIAATAANTPALQWAVGNVLVALFYLPALVMVLRRPNTGEVPRWMERLLAPASAQSERVRTTTPL
jgi:hypothetical protein